MSTATEDRTESWPDAREETEALIRERAEELDGRNGLTPAESAILANRAVHQGPDYLGALDDALELVEALTALADLSEIAPDGREVPIRHPASSLIRRLADELEEARRRVQENIWRYDYTLAKIEPASDLSGYVETRETPPIDVSDVEGVGSRE